MKNGYISNEIMVCVSIHLSWVQSLIVNICIHIRKNVLPRRTFSLLSRSLGELQQAKTENTWVLFAVAVVFLEEANEKMRNAWDMSTFGVFMVGMKASAGA